MFSKYLCAVALRHSSSYFRISTIIVDVLSIGFEWTCISDIVHWYVTSRALVLLPECHGWIIG